MTAQISNWVALIVDDEPDNLRVAAKVLQYNGAEVHTASNGVEGLSVLDKVKPTFILLDLSMPQMDGWEMFKQVRANDGLAGTAVIALTAHAMEGDKERALDVGFNGYITKPFRINTLLADIETCLEQFTRTQTR